MNVLGLEPEATQGRQDVPVIGSVLRQAVDAAEPLSPHETCSGAELYRG